MAGIVTGEGLHRELEVAAEALGGEGPVYCVCVGTDRSTGDAFGPLVGSLLEQAGYPYVIGTLERPCDSDTLIERLKELPPQARVLAVDSAVGASVGYYQLSRGPLSPGRSMGKPLPKVGQASLFGIVCPNRANPYSALQTASLHRVLGMAGEAARAILQAFGGGERIGSPLHTITDRNCQE